MKPKNLSPLRGSGSFCTSKPGARAPGYVNAAPTGLACAGPCDEKTEIPRRRADRVEGFQLRLRLRRDFVPSSDTGVRRRCHLSLCLGSTHHWPPSGGANNATGGSSRESRCEGQTPRTWGNVEPTPQYAAGEAARGGGHVSIGHGDGDGHGDGGRLLETQVFEG